MKVIFLDIDGVINTLMISKKPFGCKGRNCIERDGYYYDLCNSHDGRVSNEQAVIWLDKICRDYNLSIVLSSTWRYDFQQACECIYNTGLSRDVKIIGATPILHQLRGNEIQAYLDQHPEIEDFIILDDDSDMCHLSSHLIQCDPNAGITNGTRIKIGEYFKK